MLKINMKSKININLTQIRIINSGNLRPVSDKRRVSILRRGYEARVQCSNKLTDVFFTIIFFFS